MNRTDAINIMFWLLIPVVLIGGACNNRPEHITSAPVKKIELISEDTASLLIKNIKKIFAERLEHRGVQLVNDNAALKVSLTLKAAIGKEGFTIEKDRNGNVIISGNDERGLLYGVGKFLRTATYSADGFTAGNWTGTSIPQKEIRGIYWATHFYNYYQTAPVEDIKRYVEDLALWGYNNIEIWYDMHHFKSFNDPVAVEFRQRITHIMEAAKAIGMGVSFTMVANEAYVDGPLYLRAASGSERGAVYAEDICPNKPGGMEYILKVRGEFFDWCKQFNPDYFTLWPYDPGGCGTHNCQPWGSNGFLKCAEAVAKLAKEMMPHTKVILSTWMFDSTEWSGLEKRLPEVNKWMDVVMAEKIPGAEKTYKGLFTKLSDSITSVGFPEISMYKSFPWGGFGANPFPKTLLKQWKEVSSVSSGGFPYSEGIFDDINKITYAQLYWNGGANLDDILNEYIRYELGVPDTDSILKIIYTLEQNHHMRWWPGKLEGIKLIQDWFPSKNTAPQEDPGAEAAYDIVKNTNGAMADWAKSSWRWRILFIRTMLDAELKANGGSPNQKCYDGFYELLRLYHCTKDTDPVVKPPLSASDYK